MRMAWISSFVSGKNRRGRRAGEGPESEKWRWPCGILLEQQDVAVLMTREDAGGLYDERTSNKNGTGYAAAM